MSVLGFIPDDGYTLDFYFAEVPTLHPAVRGKVRPLLVEEYGALLAEMKRSAHPNHLLSRVMATRILSWDLKDAKGDSVVVNEKTCSRLNSRLFDRLFDYIAGTQPCDLDPEASPQADENRTIVEALLSGKNLGEVRQEQDAKN